MIVASGVWPRCRLDPAASNAWQLGDVGRDPPRLVAGDALAVSLNHLVGGGEQHGRHGDA